MKLPIGKTQLKIHGMLPFLWLFAWITGAGSGLLPAFLALILHESGHLLAAKRLKMRVQSVEITPYGGVIAIENMEYAPPAHAFGLACAGPVFSLIGCFLSIILLKFPWISFSFSLHFFRGNLLLFLLNLLPALPLDGGRMLRAILARHLPYARITRILTAIGNGLGLVLCAFSFFSALLGNLNLSPIFAGLYLLYASALESRQAITRYISALIARRQRLENNEIMPVEIIAASGKMSVLSLLGRLNERKYHLILVLSEDGLQPIGRLDEQAFCTGVMQSPDATLQSLVQEKKNGQEES